MRNTRLVFALFFAAGSAFGSGLPKASVQAVIKSLQDSNVDVRIAAAQALTQVPEEAAAKPLENALIASSDGKEQDALVAALKAVNDKASAKRLIDALSNPQFTWGTGAKAKAVEVVAISDDKKTIKWLTDVLSTDQEPAVRAAALRALGTIGAPPKKEKS